MIFPKLEESEKQKQNERHYLGGREKALNSMAANRGMLSALF